ncbi:MAG: hypothetical protein Q9200_003349 [Gallowayella weberi]
MRNWLATILTGTVSHSIHLSRIKTVLTDATDEKELFRGFSRAYSITLSPHLIYARSNLVPALVSSKVYRQLEFLAVGTWWICDVKESDLDRATVEEANSAKQAEKKVLRRVPGSREDAFANRSISLRDTRSLMKVLRGTADPEIYPTMIGEAGHQSFQDFLESQYMIDPKLQAPLQALTLSPDPPAKTSVAFAVPRLHRHITSIGIFGPGFGAVVPKWGGLAEIAQVACRAGAVGGGVYVLKQGIDSISQAHLIENHSTSEGADQPLSNIKLQGGNEVKARWIIGTKSTLHSISDWDPPESTMIREITHLTAIVSSPLTTLFTPPAEGSPPPASVVVVLPPNLLELPKSLDPAEVPATYLIIHSSDTAIIYASLTLPHPSASDLLSSAIETLLSALPNESSKPDILWSLSYKQHHSIPSLPSPPIQKTDTANPLSQASTPNHGILHLQDLGPSLALEDDVLKDVRAVWERVTADDGESRGSFMLFEDREVIGGEDGEDV